MFFIQTIKKYFERKAAIDKADEEDRNDLYRRLKAGKMIYDKVKEIENAGVKLDGFLSNFTLNQDGLSFWIEFDVDDKLKVRVGSVYEPKLAYRVFGNDEIKLHPAIFFVNGLEVMPENVEQMEQIAIRVCVLLNRKFEKEYLSRKMSLKEWMDKTDLSDNPKKQLVVEKSKTAKKGK